MEEHKFDPNRQAYTIAEFAAFFGRHRGWAYRQVREGRIKVIRGYGALLIPAAEIQRMLQSAEAAD